MEIKKVAVLGAGAMGSGIVQVVAQAGYEVWVRDIKDEFLEKGKANIEKNLRRAVNKGKISLPRYKEIMNRIHFTTDLEKAVKDADLVIEAVPEIMDLKKQVFQDVCKYNSKALLATNTSGLSITELSKATDRPEMFVGMHFFNPVPVMALVEVIKGEKTGDEALNNAIKFVKSIGKTPVVVKKDVEGFIVNRCLVPYLILAIDDAEKGVAEVEEIDAELLYTYKMPMGPLELSDFVGLDILYYAGQQWDIVPKSKLLEEKFNNKELGMKTAKGFYDWRGGRPKIPKEKAGKYDALRVIAPMINIAADLIAMGVADAKEIDTAMKLGTNMPKGPLEMADEIGLDVILSKVEEIYKEKGYEILKPSEYLKKLVSDGKLGKKTSEGFYKYEAGTYQNIRIEKLEKGIAKLVLNRPHRLNTITIELLDELKRALDELSFDNEVRVIVITGEGKAFSAGLDLQAVGTDEVLNPSVSMLLSAKGQEAFTAIEKTPKPVVAAINGYAFGGGCELALACDFRITAKNAQIGLTETSLGLIPGWGGTQRMAKILGIAKAKELIMFAKRLNGEEAEKVGLVNKAVDPEKFWDEVMEFATQLAESAPIALRLAKFAINFGYELPVEAGQTIEAAYFGITTSTDDVKEGFAAFFEKRKPEFRGR